MFLIFLSGLLSAQNNCSLSLSGTLICSNDKEPLFPAIVGIDGSGKGVQTDVNGKFTFTNICAGSHHIKAAFIGYKELDTVINVSGDLKVKLYMQSSDMHLKEVHITAQQIKKQEVQTLQKDEISGTEIEKTRGQSLGESLKSITGVNSVQTGPNISKPMIHGMYGNRVLLINNGVRLESQTWGSDHAPEIDPFIATKLSVIKGAASIRYGTDAIAGVVLVDPKDMPTSKCLQGEINLVGATNGRSGTTSGFLEGAFDKKLEGLSWRVQGTIKEAGNYSTPTYYLDNSGMKENNYSGALNYNKKNYGAEVFYSSFNTTIGIFSGSDAGNLKDLLLLFNSPRPILPDSFTYAINRDYQVVHHDMLKAKAFCKLNKAGKLTFTFGTQQNHRSEFGQDFHGGVGTNTPDAYFQLFSQTSELIWEHPLIKNISGSIGADFNTQGNVYQGLDFRALIPNYRNYGGGMFILEKWNKKKLTIETGARYDYLWMRTYTEDFTTLTKHSSDLNWQNTSGTLGVIYKFNETLSLNSCLGIGWRPPSPIELFAHGVHQSAASYEIGDTTLKAERSYNSQAYFNFTSKKLVAEIGGYFNTINNFIFLQPEAQPVITIAGAFPAFKYTQANVFYTGVDANINYSITKSISIISKTTFVYAYNKTIHDYLIYVPANRFDNGISFSRDSLWRLRQTYFAVSVLAVSKQNHVPANSDYVPPPKGYKLLNAEIGFSIPVQKQMINISFSANNILNTVYRDYLNRFRYYANDLGRNFTLRLRVPFSVFKTKSADE